MSVDDEFDGELDRPEDLLGEVEEQRILAQEMEAEEESQDPEEERWEEEEVAHAKGVLRRHRIKELSAVTRDYRTLRRANCIMSQAAAARVLDVHPTRIGELIAEGRLVQMRFPALGMVGVTIASLELYRSERRETGLTDAFSELRSLEEEEREAEETERN